MSRARVKVLYPPDTTRPAFLVTADVITGSKPRVIAIPLASVIVCDSPRQEKTAAGRIQTMTGVYAIKDGNT